MTRTSVSSTAIKSIGYEGGTLEVEFANGRVHQYAGVSQADFDAFLAADSKGKHFGKHVRPHFAHTRVGGDEIVEQS